MIRRNRLVLAGLKRESVPDADDASDILVAKILLLIWLQGNENKSQHSRQSLTKEIACHGYVANEILHRHVKP